MTKRSYLLTQRPNIFLTDPRPTIGCHTPHRPSTVGRIYADQRPKHRSPNPPRGSIAPRPTTKGTVHPHSSSRSLQPVHLRHASRPGGHVPYDQRRPEWYHFDQTHTPPCSHPGHPGYCPRMWFPTSHEENVGWRRSGGQMCNRMVAGL